MTAPFLSGPGRFETLADDGARFHLRQSSLTEKTLLGYTLTCLALAACLAVMGAELAFQPRASWLGFLIMPAGALWLLRYNGEVIADRQRRLVHVKVRTLGFWENARSIAFDEVTGVVASGAGAVGEVALETAGASVPLARAVHAGAARRLAMRVAAALGREARIEGTWTSRADEDPSEKAPGRVDDGSPRAYDEERFGDGFRAWYPTRSYGTAAVLFVCSTFFGAVAAMFLGWAINHLIEGPVNFSRVMLVTTPSALLGLCGMLFYSGVCLSIGHEVITCDGGVLEARTMLAGWRAGFLRVAMEDLKEVRTTCGIKLLWEGGARHVAATLPNVDQERLCESIREYWSARKS
jgi:hypothetical protein